MSSRTRQRLRALGLEPLEDRWLLSGVPAPPTGWHARPALALAFSGSPDGYGTTNPTGLAPDQIRGAYGLGIYDNSGVLNNAILFHGTQGDGSGETIAIVDSYDDPAALVDLNTFSDFFHLPQFNAGSGPTFAKLNEYGGTSLPDTEPGGQWGSGGEGWEVEESLDIEWAHAMAPKANIILFEAADENNGPFIAAQTAAATPGVVAVSMSWSGDEFSGENGFDSYFTTPAGHGGVTFFTAAGDSGANTPQYPACSPNVVAVGGTTLYVSGNYPDFTYGGEAAWSEGGGGISAYESQPSYQSGVAGAYSTTYRTYPDVSADADPTSGVPVCDSWDFGASTPWFAGPIGGTSLACPLWAGFMTIADQGRSIAGLTSLDGPSQTLPQLYKLPHADLNDILSGSNGNGAAPGYDLATGLGTPGETADGGSLLIPQLAGPSILAFAQGPTDALAGAGIAPSITVDVEDALGNTLTTDNSNVTLSIGSNSPGGLLLGMRTVAAVDGVATFTGLGIDTPGSGYTLVALDGGLSTAASDAFGITANPDQPAVAVPAGASLATATTASLSALGADPSGNESGLTYTWSTLAWPGGASPPSISPEPGISSGSATAAFRSAGTYVFLVTITDAGSGFSVGSTATVTVSQTLTSIGVSGKPPAVSALDQFGEPLASPPAFNAGSDAILSPLALAANVTLLPAAGTRLTISGGVSGAGGLTIDAPGTVVLAAANFYTGRTTDAAGTLILTNSSALAAGSSLMVGANAVLMLGPADRATPSLVMAATAPAIATSAAMTTGSAATVRSAGVTAAPMAQPAHFQKTVAFRSAKVGPAFAERKATMGPRIASEDMAARALQTVFAHWAARRK